MDQTASRGRPRSEAARAAVLHAVDDLLVEVGYGNLTLKGIAERAGVGRQTVYRWWSTKAEILLEASAHDARHELAVEATGDAVAQLTAYLDALGVFLTTSHAGAAFRALVGEAQHDPAVASLIARNDILGDSAREAIARAVGRAPDGEAARAAVAGLVGPLFFWALTGHDAAELDHGVIARSCLERLRSAP